LSSLTKTFFCNQKFRFIILWLFTSLFFLVFALFGRLQNLGEYVTLSVSVPLFLYLFTVYEKRWKESIKYRNAKEITHSLLADLAKKENPKIKNVVIKELPRKRAYGHPDKEKIVLSSALFTGEFSDREIQGLLYHEVFHTMTSHYAIQIAFLFVILWIVILSIFVVLSFLASVILFLTGGFFCSMFMILYERINWRSEFKADERSSEKVGTEVFISALMKTAPPEKRNCDSPTHPSVNRRICRIKKRTTS